MNIILISTQQFSLYPETPNNKTALLLSVLDPNYRYILGVAYLVLAVQPEVVDQSPDLLGDGVESASLGQVPGHQTPGLLLSVETTEAEIRYHNLQQRVACCMFTSLCFVFS